LSACSARLVSAHRDAHCSGQCVKWLSPLEGHPPRTGREERRRSRAAESFLVLIGNDASHGTGDDRTLKVLQLCPSLHSFFFCKPTRVRFCRSYSAGHYARTISSFGSLKPKHTHRARPPCTDKFTLQQTNPYTLMHRQVHATTNKSIHIAVVDATERGKARTSEPQTASRSYICNLLHYTRAPSRSVMLLIILLLALDRLHDAVDRRRDVVHGREPAFVFHLRRCRQQTDRSARGER
jgi:hypothetical protein